MTYHHIAGLCCWQPSQENCHEGQRCHRTCRWHGFLLDSLFPFFIYFYLPPVTNPHSFHHFTLPRRTTVISFYGPTLGSRAHKTNKLLNGILLHPVINDRLHSPLSLLSKHLSLAGYPLIHHSLGMVARIQGLLHVGPEGTTLS